MKKDKISIDSVDKFNYISDYNQLFNTPIVPIISQKQWLNVGDFFNKFSLYDNSYIPIGTLEGTTLIK